MRIINTDDKVTSKLWKKIPFNNAESYRRLKYVLEAEADEGFLLLNTVTGELVLLDDEEKAMPELVEKHFFVPAGFDEETYIGQLKEVRQKLDRRKHHNSYSILPTTMCNARCFYCFEQNYEHCHMSQETAQEITDYICQHRKPGHKVFISWFGGEPLVGMDRISQICRGLDAAGVEFASHMVSNAYLFDDDVVAEAKECWRLEKVQVTLDGTEEVYNETKSYVGVKDNPYYRVLDNIQRLVDNKISVDIRLNLGFDNKDDLIALLDELESRFREDDYAFVYVHELTGGDNYNCDYASADTTDVLIRDVYEIWNEIDRRGLSPHGAAELPKLKFDSCMADNDSFVQFNPKGEITKCEHYIEDYVVGTVKEGITDRELIKDMKKSVLFDECHTCPLVPCCHHIAFCPEKKRCYSQEKERKIAGIKRAMLDAYEKWKKEQKETE